MNRLEFRLCPNCGKEQPAAATSCSFCGAPLCFGDTERSSRIRQLLDGEDAVPAPPAAPFVPNAPQPEPVPTEEPEPAPDAAPPKGVRQWIRRHIRLTIAHRSGCRRPDRPCCHPSAQYTAGVPRLAAGAGGGPKHRGRAK